MSVFPMSKITMDEVDKYIDGALKYYIECEYRRKIIKLMWKNP
jgi:hypothetical protein